MGAVLVVTMALAGAGVANAAWSGMDPLTTGRYNHTATVLADGRVLVAGGADSAPLASARIYDPTTSTWSEAGSMHLGRQGQAAVLLRSGKLLVAGGTVPAADAVMSAGDYTATAEIYDPAGDTWTDAASMATARFEPTMTVLKDGKVLVAGGVGDVGNRRGVALDTAEIYDPATDRWSDGGKMTAARSADTATLLPSGDVLVAAGYDSAAGELASAELYHPGSNDWSATDSLATARDSATATALPNGDVLVAGGDGGSGSALASAEVYSAGSGTWHAIASMADARQSAAAALLKDGTVLVAGGETARNNGTLLASSERYDPGADTWTDGGALAIARTQFTVTALPDGRALAVGGNLGGFAAGSTDVERFSAVTAGLTPLTFPKLTPGTASDVQTSTLTNSGKLPLIVGAVTVAGGAAKDYEIVSDTCHDATIAAGAGCTIDVRFTPSAGGNRAATLTVADNTAAGTTTATLAGTGDAPAPAAPADGGSNQGGSSSATPSTPAAPSAGGAAAGAGTTVAPQPGIAVGAQQARHRAARATCKVRTARSHGRTRSTVTCVVAWPTNDTVALSARLVNGKRTFAGARATARGGRATLRLRATGRLRAGRYTVAITRGKGTLVLSSAVRVR